MPMFVNSDRPVFDLPGIRHQTLAAKADGLAHLGVCYQSLDPRGGTLPHYHSEHGPDQRVSRRIK